MAQNAPILGNMTKNASIFGNMAQNASISGNMAQNALLLGNMTQNASILGNMTQNASLTNSLLNNLPFTNSTEGVDETSLYQLYPAADLVLMHLFLWVSMIATFAGSSLILYTIIKYEVFHIPHFMFMVAYIIGDLLQVVGKTIPSLVILIADVKVPRWFCSTIGQLPNVGLYTGVQMLGIIAAERYCFLCFPLRFRRLFTNKRSAILIGAIWLFCISYNIVSDVVGSRKFHYNILICRAERNQKLLTILQWLILVLPNVIITAFSMLKVFLESRRLRVAPAMPAPLAPLQPNVEQISTSLHPNVEQISTSLHPNLEQNDTPPQPNVEQNDPLPQPNVKQNDPLPQPNVKQNDPPPQPNVNNNSSSQCIRRSLRMMLFMTGAVYCILLPAFSVQTIVFKATGLTWADLEAGRDMSTARVVRACNMCMFTVTPLVNVAVHLYTHPQLRHYCFRVFN